MLLIDLQVVHHSLYPSLVAVDLFHPAEFALARFHFVGRIVHQAYCRDYHLIEFGLDFETETAIGDHQVVLFFGLIAHRQSYSV